MSSRRERVIIDPQRYGGDPYLAGCRERTSTTACHWWDGVLTPENMAETTSGMTRGELLLACWYETYHGRKLGGHAMKCWADHNCLAVWQGRWNDIPWPPQAPATGGSTAERERRGE